MVGVDFLIDVACFLALPVLGWRILRGAVPMAEAGARQAESPDVARLAQQMAAAQESEIRTMQDLLRARGVAPEPDGPGASSTHGGTHG